ncbi:MAG TPA: hypothetical protein ENI95_11000 [Chloroflexi bacterium]|nr:hypothetical protein [Chloroflexota bacterium]
MMPDMLISALVQAPFVLAMAYLVQRFLAHLDARDREWQETIRRTYETVDALAERMDELTGAIKDLRDIILTHDALTRGRVTSPPPVHAAERLKVAGKKR